MCQSILCCEAPTDSFVNQMKYDITSDLKYPSQAVQTFLQLADNIIYKNLSKIIYKLQPKKTILDIINREMPYQLKTCQEHQNAHHFLLNRFVLKSIRIFCKDDLQKRINKRRETRKRRKLAIDNFQRKKLRTT